MDCPSHQSLELGPGHLHLIQSSHCYRDESFFSESISLVIEGFGIGQGGLKIAEADMVVPLLGSSWPCKVVGIERTEVGVSCFAWQEASNCIEQHLDTRRKLVDFESVDTDIHHLISGPYLYYTI